MKILYDAGELSQYDGTELSAVVEFTHIDGTRICEALATLDVPDLSSYSDATLFYSVYLHLKTGGTQCIADFDLLDDAQIYCHALDSILGD